MKSTFYGKKMFIADLILIGIWAFFYHLFTSIEAMFIVLIRIALCFEMRRRSPWTLVSAIGFALAYSFSNYVRLPFQEMLRMALHAVGYGEQMAKTYSEPFGESFETSVTIVTAIWCFWLVVMPLIVGICQRNIGRIPWKNKWVLGYLLGLPILCIINIIVGDHSGFVLEGFVLALLPLIYWMIYERKGRSVVQLILSDRQIVWFLRYFLFMLVVAIIGLYETPLRLIGLLLMPPAFYVLLVKSSHLGDVLTRCCVALSVSGLCYWLMLDTAWDDTIWWLVVALLLIAFVGVTMIVKTRKWAAAIILVLTIPVVVIPGLLGLNPYIAMEANYIRCFKATGKVYNGVYIVEQEDKTGMRDRYGVILPIKYDDIEPLDRNGRFVSLIADEYKYGVYDLRKREFVIAPNMFPEMVRIEPVDEVSFRLINIYERPFATLYLPGIYEDNYIREVRVEPYFSEAETPVADFVREAEDVDWELDNDYWQDMLNQNPHAYNLLVKMFYVGTEECSPFNDLNYARAFREIIKKDTRYKGNVSKALNEVEKVSEILTYSGSQRSLNEWTDCLRLIASTRVSLAYDSLMAIMPENEAVTEEYIAWHNMMFTMACYQDFLYSDQSYLAIPEEKNARIMSWLDYRRNALSKERDILSGKLTYSVPAEREESLREDYEFMDLFANFHSFEKPEFYNPMWNEIKWTFEQWKDSRENVAEELPPHEALSYREYTREVTDSIFSFIEELDFSGFRPVF